MAADRCIPTGQRPEPLRQITRSMVLRWQHELEGKLSHSGVMACRSILGRILETARKERLIATNPIREVEAPKPRLDPEQVFGHQRRRTLTPEEVGHLLAACRPFYRDHFLIQVGTNRAGHRVDPNAVRQLQPGQAVLVSGGRGEQIQVIQTPGPTTALRCRAGRSRSPVGASSAPPASRVRACGAASRP